MMIAIPNEKLLELKKGDLALIEIGTHSGNYVIGKIAYIHKQKNGSVVYFHRQYWDYPNNRHEYMAVTDSIGLTQCQKLIM